MNRTPNVTPMTFQGNPTTRYPRWPRWPRWRMWLTHPIRARRFLRAARAPWPEVTP